MPAIAPSITAIRISRLSLGACLALLAACPPDTVQPTTGTGDDGSSSTGGDPGSTGAPTTSTTAPASTTAPDPGSTGPAGVCGDGTVDAGELCDDGNDVPEDGCDSKCQPTAAIEWTLNIDYNKKSDGANDVVVDATGRIIVAGWATVADGPIEQLLLVLDPDGTEVWKRTFPADSGLEASLNAVVVDAQGRIFAAGSEQVAEMHLAHVLRAVDADGTPLWEFKEPNAEIDYGGLADLVLAGDTIYTVGSEELGDKGARIVVRAHDPAQPDAPVWRVDSNADTFYAIGSAIAATGGELVIVGRAGAKFNESKPLVMRVGTDGTILSVDVADDPDAAWFALAPIGDAGDLLLGGRRVAGVTGLDATVRRITADGAEVWTDVYDHDFLYDAIFALAVGPDDAIVAGGVAIKEGENENVLVRRLSGDGAPRWSSFYNDADFDLYDFVSGVAYGPDFAVAAGRSAVIGQGSNLWIRRFEHP